MIGSVGSATLLYGLALIYGATGAMRFDGIAAAIAGDQVNAADPLLLTGIALAATGLAFKASVAPFHQWTPDVYQGAPTPITTFMAVATKAAAFAIFLRLFDEALGLSQLDWGPALAVARGDDDRDRQRRARSRSARSSGCSRGRAWRRPATCSPASWSGTQLGLQATAFYLAVYLLMNVAAFAVVIARERVSELGDDICARFENLGTTRSRWLAWPMTIAMLVARRLPGHRRLHRQVLFDRRRRRRRLRLARHRDRDRLGALARVLPARDRGDVDGPRRGGAADACRRGACGRVAGWSPEADAAARSPRCVAVAVICAAATIFFGIGAGPAVRRRPRREQRLPRPALNPQPS